MLVVLVGYAPRHLHHWCFILSIVTYPSTVVLHRQLVEFVALYLVYLVMIYLIMMFMLTLISLSLSLSLMQDGVLVMGSTNRYRDKYITTLMYKPV